MLLSLLLSFAPGVGRPAEVAVAEALKAVRTEAVAVTSCGSDDDCESREAALVFTVSGEGY